ASRGGVGEVTDLEEALRSELRHRAEAADREVSLLGPVARRVRRAHRRCAAAASTLTTIAAAAITVALPALPVLQPAAAPAYRRRIMAGPLDLAGPVHGREVGPVPGYGTSPGRLPVITAGPAPGRVSSVSNPVFARSVRLAYGPRARVPASWRWHDI